MRPLTAACLAAIPGLAVIGATTPMTNSLAASEHRSLTQRGPTLRTSVVLGYSVEHRPIAAWKLTSGPAQRSVLVVGSIAGDEPGGIAVTRVLASDAASAGVNLWLIPDMNPDARVRGTRVNADGVDLNRNFPFRWRHGGDPGSRYYSGPSPASEPETRAIESFIRRVRPELSIWLHQPYRLIDDSEGPRWAEQYLARATRLPLRRLPDYPGSAIGWDDHVVPSSAFDVELPGGELSQTTIRRVTTGIRSLVSSIATHGAVHNGTTGQ